MATHALVFGSYTIPYIQMVKDNFRTLQSRIEPIAGASGGYDSYGIDSPPAGVGQVQVTLKLLALALDDMQALRDALATLSGSGQLKLSKTTQGSLGVRWCYAKLVDSQLPERWADHTDLIQDASLLFSVADPHWLMDEATATLNITGTSQDVTITHNGNGIALMKATLACGVGQTTQNPKIRRLVGGIVADEVAWTGTVAASTSLIINGQSKSILNNGADAYAAMTFIHPDWLRLLPGANVFRVIAANAGDRGTVTFAYYPTYIS